MEVLTVINSYFEKLAFEILNTYEEDFNDLEPDVSIKITGLSFKELLRLNQEMKRFETKIENFILVDNETTNGNHLSINQINTLIENQKSNIFILIPNDKNVNFNAFKKPTKVCDLAINSIQKKLLDRLILEIPEPFNVSIRDDIISCLKHLNSKLFPDTLIIKYLITLQQVGYTIENIGNYIYLLNLIPDAYLFANGSDSTRNRLSSNIDCINLLLLEKDKTLYERISELPLEVNSVQRLLVDLFRNEEELKTVKAFCTVIFNSHTQLNFANWDIKEEEQVQIALPTEHVVPKYDLLVGNTSRTSQYGIIGESLSGRKIAIDLSGTNTISLFGVQGGGKSYTIGTISEMVLKQFSAVNQLPSPLAGVIFHYSESMDYEPEFTSMIYPNDKKREIEKLKERYGAHPNSLDDVIIICPKDKVDEKRLEYPSVTVEPIAFNPKELNVQDWMFMLGAIGNDANYVKQLKAIAKKYRKDISIDSIEKDVKASILFTEFEKGLALQKLGFAKEYIDEAFNLGSLLRPGRLIIVDLRDEFIDKDEALGLFVIILNIFSAVKEFNAQRFNKFIVFDEAHKYMDNIKLTSTIVTAIREMRHKGVSIMIASQDPPSLPKEIIELSSVVLLHKFNSPQWLDHIKNALTQLEILAPQDMSVLTPGEGYLWATKATEKGVTYKPLKISARPRVTQHGGATLSAGGKK